MASAFGGRRALPFVGILVWQSVSLSANSTQGASRHAQQPNQAPNASKDASLPGCAAAAAKTLDARAIDGLLAEQARALSGCAGERFLLKQTPECLANATRRDAADKCTRSLFVTGTGYSGTHWLAVKLAALQLGHVQHELKARVPWKRPDVLVSWPTRADAALGLRSRYQTPRAPFADLGSGTPLVDWATEQLEPRCRFAVVAHVTRHPLSALASMLTGAAKCSACFALFEHLAAARVANFTCAAKRVVARRQRAAAPRIPLAADDRRVLAEAFMLQYVLWHAEIDAHADVRVPIEAAEPAERLCAAAGAQCDARGRRRVDAAGGAAKEWPDADACRARGEAARARGAGASKHSHGGGALDPPLSWGELRGVNADLEAALWRVAQKYGYDRDVPLQLAMPNTPSPACKHSTNLSVT